MKAVDLFSGCGGLSCGLKQANLEILLATDHWSTALESYEANHPTTKTLCCEAHEFQNRVNDDKALKSILSSADIIVGGPPCQGFCGINRHRSKKDPRNSLVESFYLIIDRVRPRFFLMENVNGILSIDGGRPFSGLLSAFRESGYEVNYHIVQAGGFGVPQNRWRVFVLGSRDKRHIPPAPKPLFSFPRMPIFDAGRESNHAIWPLRDDPESLFPFLRYVNVRETIGDLPAVGNGEAYGVVSIKQSKSSRLIRWLNPNSQATTDHETLKLGPVSMERVHSLPAGSGASWVDLPLRLRPKNLSKLEDIRYRNRYGRLNWEGIFNTILHKPEPYWGRVLHPEQDRVISVRECARAQTFPDGFRFAGNTNDKYLQVGNAVPPILGMFLGWSFRLANDDRAVNTEIEAFGKRFQA